MLPVLGMDWPSTICSQPYIGQRASDDRAQWLHHAPSGWQGLGKPVVDKNITIRELVNAKRVSDSKFHYGNRA